MGGELLGEEREDVKQLVSLQIAWLPLLTAKYVF